MQPTSKIEFFKALVIEAICHILPNNQERMLLCEKIVMQSISDFELILRFGDHRFEPKIFTSSLRLNVGGKNIEFKDNPHSIQQMKDYVDAWGVPVVPGGIATIYSCNETRRVKVKLEFLASTPVRNSQTGAESSSIIYWKQKSQEKD